MWRDPDNEVTQQIPVETLQETVAVPIKRVVRTVGLCNPKASEIAVTCACGNVARAKSFREVSAAHNKHTCNPGK